MRHGKKFNHLGRTSAHRKAMLSNMACSLIEHKRINTTLAKAKALRKYVEPLITKAKNDSTHSRRMAFRKLQSKEAVKELFGPISQKIGDRPGGYTRILRTGFRYGDNADMCLIELVDFNEGMLKAAGAGSEGKKSRRKRTRRGRRKDGAAETTNQNNVAEQSDGTFEDAQIVEDTMDQTQENITDVVEDATDTTSDDTTTGTDDTNNNV